jgi:hypothetical protein
MICFKNYKFIFLFVVNCITTYVFSDELNKKAQQDKDFFIIDSIYAKLHDGFSLTVKKQKEFIGSPADATYGEITYRGAKELFADLNLGPNDIFYDLGSGVGKMIVQAYLTTSAKKVVGIELSSLRAQQADKALVAMKKRGLLSSAKQINFIEGDFLKQSLDDATVIYICNTTFSKKLMTNISAKLASLKAGVRVVSYKKLDSCCGADRFKLEKMGRYQTSWNSRGSTVHIYKL